MEIPDIAKLVRLFASDRDGEALAAMRAAQRKLRKAGLTWHDVADRLSGIDTLAATLARAMAGGSKGPEFNAYCFNCGEPIGYVHGVTRRTKRFCSTRCRVAFHRRNKTRGAG